MNTNHENFKVGDEAWFVPGYAQSYLIAIKVKVIEVDDYGYWIDEPVGHEVSDYDLLTREQAEKELRNRYLDHFAYCSRDVRDAAFMTQEEYESARKDRHTLDDYRTASKDFIKSTWPSDTIEGFPVYQDKVEGEDWFVIDHKDVSEEAITEVANTIEPLRFDPTIYTLSSE
ncbi:MAG: hypothetical protein KGH64_00555 [Candidatus Micrarchaeota archaeon]|nr:hypothetical protein [Candidatus Micrarchaeota archaeon]